MAIIVNCPCGRKLKIQDEFAGQEGTCPACNRVLQIPLPEDDLEVIQPAEPPTLEPASEEINNHGGDPIPDNADFFVDPPQEIGPLLTPTRRCARASDRGRCGCAWCCRSVSASWVC